MLINFHFPSAGTWHLDIEYVMGICTWFIFHLQQAEPLSMLLSFDLLSTINVKGVV